ncbi:hypothetical protein K7X08_034008 [Anisodus acutangulus]|uniref:C2H2-type domain-containing protein n=1 Tax=Anisodus acutangulus TaxID=402998 RepID=A0A9Q1LRB8_9SOLA|nr:hypothetical protein K7X08_034008 [Anisodus acutangulus]
MRSHLINEKKQLHSDFSEGIYVLRENPNKTSKVSEYTLLTYDKRICKECGKSFQSWKALFGHMKCHSTTRRDSVEEDSWNTQSDSPKKKRSSSTRMKRYMAATTSSTLTLSTNNSSEFDQEEEVAMSLIMLSKDVANWLPVTETSDANSQSHTLLTHKNKSDNEFVIRKKDRTGKAEQGESNRSNIRESGIPRNVCKMDEKENETIVDNGYRTEVEFPNKLVKLEMDSDQKENCSKKRSFEKNAFYSLGGHKASHKKLEGCENTTIEILHLHNQAAHSKLIKNCSSDITIDESGQKVEANHVTKKKKEHEFPICFKIFQSGQALGGHKRSHLIAEAKKNGIRAVEIQKPIPEMRGFLDLNLPAPVEEEHIEFQPWWIGSSHKHEQLVGLLS